MWTLGPTRSRTRLGSRYSVFSRWRACPKRALAAARRQKHCKTTTYYSGRFQHRVKNNLQMITALIRIEARNVPDDATGARFDRLAGRINALAVLYDALARENANNNVDLGVYLGQIASAVMQAHAVEGIRLDMKLDTWPVSVNVAMPAGLVVNELLTNSLKHAFVGREGGTIKLHSLVDDDGCHISIADDGVGLPDGTIWPKPGKLGAIIVQSLRQNASAKVTVTSSPGNGMSVTISFAKAASSQSSE